MHRFADAGAKPPAVTRDLETYTMLALSLFIASASASGVLRSQPVTGVCDDPAAQESGYFDIAAGTKHYF